MKKFSLVLVGLLFASVSYAFLGADSSSSGGAGTWGSITGTLSTQSDLQSALDAKSPAANPTFTGTIATPLTVSSVVKTDGSGNLSTGTVSLSSQVSGNLPVTNLNSGTSASSTTFWSGAGTWATPAGSGLSTSSGGTVTGNVTLTKGSDTTLTGTTVATSGTTVTGVGTHFLTEAHVNDIFTFPTCDTTPIAITAIASDTSMTLAHTESTCPATASQAKVSPSILVTTSASGTPLWYIDAGGALRHGTAGSTVFAVGTPETTITRIMGDTSSNRQVIVQGTEQAYDYEGLSFGGSSSGWLAKLCGGGACASLTSAGMSVPAAVYTATTTYTPSGTTQTVDWKLSNSFILNVGSASGNVTVTWSNKNTGQRIRMKVVQGATPRTVTIGSTKYPGGTAYPATSSANAIDLLTCEYDGTDTLCRYDLNFS